MTVNEINEKYVKKSEFLLLHPDETIPQEMNVNKWMHFLPPFKKTEISQNIQNVSSDFEKQLKHVIKKGDSKQSRMLSTLTNKNLSFSLLVVETINDIVKNKNPLLKTLADVFFRKRLL